MPVITGLQVMPESAKIKINASINFQSHLPYYVQLLEFLKEHIKKGIWKPGELIPSEKKIGEYYQVSRTTVRLALRELELEGLIFKRKGKGSFVTRPKISEGLIQKLTGFHHDMVERGLTPVTKVLDQQVIPNIQLLEMGPKDDAKKAAEIFKGRDVKFYKCPDPITELDYSDADSQTKMIENVLKAGEIVPIKILCEADDFTKGMELLNKFRETAGQAA